MFVADDPILGCDRYDHNAMIVIILMGYTNCTSTNTSGFVLTCGIGVAQCVVDVQWVD